MVPTSPTIMNAIYDAIGVRIKSLPATPEKILNALKRRSKTEVVNLIRFKFTLNTREK